MTPVHARSAAASWMVAVETSQQWTRVGISFFAFICAFSVGVFSGGKGFAAVLGIVSVMGVISAGGVLVAVPALIGARRAQDRLLVVLAAIGLAVNCPLLLWAGRMLGVALVHFAST